MKICVFTSARADYGLLKPVMAAIKAHPDLTLQTLAGGNHFLEQFGNTYKAIEADGFTIDARVPLQLRDGSTSAITHAAGESVGAIGDALDTLKPDALLFLGDRYELMAAAMVAAIRRIPMVHLFGGEITRGAFDEQFRHALTKMAHIHCTPTPETAARIIQMGEDPAHVFVTGHPALDALKNMPLLDRAGLEADLGIALDNPVHVLTYHPETLSGRDVLTDLNIVLDGVSKGIGDDATLIITKPNADPGFDTIIKRIDAFAAGRPKTKAFQSLGQVRYYSLLKQAVSLIGNSSSGLHEAPSFGVYTVNIGDRQLGRIRAASVTDVPVNAAAIASALGPLKHRPATPAQNPYEKDGSSRLIVEAILTLARTPDILRKSFYTGAA